MVRISRLTGRFLFILTPVNNSSGGFQFSISFIIAAVTGVWGATEQKVHLSPAISSQRHNPGPSSPSLLDSVLNYGDRVGSWVENPRGGCYEIPKTTADSWCDSAVIHRMGRERERPFNRANRRYGVAVSYTHLTLPTNREV